MKVITTISIIIAAVLIHFSHADAHAQNNVTPEVLKAVLSENWETVADLLKNVHPESQSAIARLIKGHACLALNRNNDSLGLFASALDQKSRSQWQEWSEQFVKKNGQYSIAWYLHGDAFARRQVWKSSINSFDRALDINPGCYLSLSARGVVAHAVGNTLQARLFFQMAVENKKNFADAYANRGTLSVHLQSVGGESMYREANLHSTDTEPLVSTLGMGCMLYGRQEYHTARTYFDKVPGSSIMSALAQRNALVNEIALLNRTLNQANNAGMSLQSMRINRNADQPIDNVLVTEEGEIHIVLDDGEYIVYPNPDGDRGVSGMTVPVPEELMPGIRPGIVMSTTGPGKRGGRGGGVRPPKWRNPPTRPGQDEPPPGPRPKPGGGPKRKKRAKRGLGVKDIATISENIQTQVSSFKSAHTNVGGADSDPSNARSNRSVWRVSNVYGLLYSVKNTFPDL